MRFPPKSQEPSRTLGNRIIRRSNRGGSEMTLPAPLKLSTSQRPAVGVPLILCFCPVVLIYEHEKHLAIHQHLQTVPMELGLPMQETKCGWYPCTNSHTLTVKYLTICFLNYPFHSRKSKNPKKKKKDNNIPFRDSHRQYFVVPLFFSYPCLYLSHTINVNIKEKNTNI